MFEDAAQLLDLGGFGVVVAVLYWFMTRMERRMLSAEMAIKTHSVIVLSLQQQILAHDLTVTGLNPALGADFEERDSKAFKKYAELQSMIKDQKRVIIEQIVKAG